MKRPDINARDLNLPRVTDAAWRAVRAANDPPILFCFGGIPHRLERDDDGRPILRELTQDRLRHHLARDIRWYKTQFGVRVDALPPIHVVRDMLARSDPPLPVLARIIEAPTF